MQATGLKELEKGYQLEGSIRRVLCALVLLGYHLVIVYALGNSEGNLIQARAILDEQLKVLYFQLRCPLQLSKMAVGYFSQTPMAFGSYFTAVGLN